jgi:predicted flap endonuclease-1-like 5' DNA nuclease
VYEEQNVANIEDIEGIGPASATKLREMGISTVEKLLERGATPAGRKEIAATTGLRDDQVLRWVNHADLFRIKGVGAEFAELLEAAGVDTVSELARRSPANLQKAMAEKNEAKKLTRRVPSEAQVTAWVAEAKMLERSVSY